MSYWGHSGLLAPEEFHHIRVDRESELAICTEALLDRSVNVFLWGARGVGKSFLLRLVEEELDRAEPVLTAQVNVTGLRGFGQSDFSEAFPAAVLLSLCNAAWKGILGRSYSELRATLDLSEGDIRRPNKLARTIEVIYTQVMAAQRKARYEHFNSVGFSAAAKGEKSETGSVEQLQPSILPFEFFEYCEELLAALVEHGKSRIVALCDEANHLPLKEQQRLLGQYMEMFTSRRVQFLFVAGYRSDTDPPAPPEGFSCALELKGLREVDSVALLIKAAKILGWQAEESACVRVAERCGGNPRFLLSVLDRAYTDAKQVGAALDGDRLVTACIDWLHQLELYEIRSGPVRPAT
jgi:hypothetical protein